MLRTVVMEDIRGARLCLRETTMLGDTFVSWVLRYKGHVKTWNVSGDIHTSVRVWKKSGFKIVK